MKIKVAKNVYTADIADKGFIKLLIKLALKRPVQGLFVITEPLYDAGIMEIYDYNELLQPFYRKMKRTFYVVGMAGSRNSAKQIVCDILDDVYREFGKPDVKKYFQLETVESV